MDPPDDEDDVPFSQLVAKQQDPVLPDHNFDLNTPTGSPEFTASYNKQQRRHGKMFNDPVHNLFRLDPVSIDIIDSAQFQRLRDLKQLGMTYYIFPGASHNRFEHSLGTAHLAFEVADKIWNSQRAELDMDRSDVKVVELAGKRTHHQLESDGLQQASHKQHLALCNPKWLCGVQVCVMTWVMVLSVMSLTGPCCRAKVFMDGNACTTLSRSSVSWVRANVLHVTRT